LVPEVTVAVAVAVVSPVSVDPSPGVLRQTWTVYELSGGLLD
jgi:hypothetical protein